MQWLYRSLWTLVPGNPILVRVVQGGSRRARHLWIRMAYLGALVMLVLMALMSGGGMGENVTLTELAKAGTQVFAFIAYGQVILICLLAPLFMAGAIAAEQAGKTFDIMLTTPLTNLQVVLGSLFGRLFFVLALLASGLPLFSLLLIFGGVPIQAVFVSFATAALSALVMGSVAVTLSVLRVGGRKAVVSFVILVAGYLVASWVLDTLLLRRFALIPNGTTWLTPLHPLLVLETWLNRANYRPPTPEELSAYGPWARFYLGKPFEAFALMSSVLSLLLVGWSAIWVRRVGKGEGLFRVKLRRWLRLPGASGERRRPPRKVGVNPIAWREANTRGKLAAGIIARGLFVLLGVTCGAILLGLYHYGKLPTVPGTIGGSAMPPHVVFRNALITLLMLELAIITMVAIYMSASCVSREREDHTLDLILTTPVTQQQYIWGKLRGLVSFLSLMLTVPIVTVAMVSAYSVVGEMRQWPTANVSYMAGGMTATYSLMLPEAPLLLGIMLVPFVAFSVIVGMSWSVKSRGVLGAVVPALGVLGGMTLVLGFCGYSAANAVPFVGPVINSFSPVTNLLMIINPWEVVDEFMANPGMGRATLFVGALIAGCGYSGIVYLMLSGIVKGFDHTVRRLTGEH